MILHMGKHHKKGDQRVLVAASLLHRRAREVSLWRLNYIDLTEETVRGRQYLDYELRGTNNTTLRHTYHPTYVSPPSTSKQNVFKTFSCQEVLVISSQKNETVKDIWIIAKRPKVPTLSWPHCDNFGIKKKIITLGYRLC